MSLFIGFHYPCLDGAFSVLTSFLGIKSYISKYKFDSLMAKLQDPEDLATPRSCSTTSTSTSSSFTQQKKVQSMPQSRKQSPAKIQEQQTRSPKKLRKLSLCNINSPPFDITELKLQDHNLLDQQYFNPAVHPAIRYVGLTPSSKSQKILDSINAVVQKEDDLANSIIILLDFYGGSVQNLRELTKRFKKVIVLDHHISFIKLVNAGYFKDLKNFYYQFDLAKSGATIAYDFFKEYFEFEKLCSFGVLKRLQDLLPPIEDDDIQACQIPYSRDITSALYGMGFEFHPKKDPYIFFRLMSHTVEQLKPIGININQEIQRKVDKEIRHQKQIFIGGKKNCIFTGYGIMPTESSLAGDIAVRLAELSYGDQLDNIGIGYMRILIDGQENYQIYLRSSQYAEGICDIIAEQYGGGGHKGASGFTISRKDFHKWME